jgi:hypothetical protein
VVQLEVLLAMGYAVERERLGASLGVLVDEVY